MMNPKWKWAGAAAVTLVVAGVVWAQGPAAREERGGGAPRPDGRSRLRFDDPRLKEELALSDDQVAKLKTQGFTERKEAARLRSQIRVTQIELQELMEAATPDEKAVTAKAKEIGDLRSRAYQSRVAARLGVKKILTNEQQQKLRDVIRRRMEERPRPGMRERLRERQRRRAPGEPIGEEDPDVEPRLDQSIVH